MSEDLNHELIDILYRSRLTLLDHLDEFGGYDTTRFRKFSPKEIQEMITATTKSAIGAPAFQMDLQKKEGATVATDEPTKCRVIYAIHRIKHKILKFTKEVSIESEASFDPKTTEVIIVTVEPIAPTFHATAAALWMQESVRIRYFQAAAIVNNPIKHVLVPKHEKVPKDQEEPLLAQLNAKKTQFPFIRFHEDPIARMIGLLPGDIVKITRPSPTAGECVLYRVCVP